MTDQTSRRTPVLDNREPSPTVQPRDTVDRGLVAVASAAAWLRALPLWFGDGLASPLFPIVAAMVTPALVVVFFVDRPQQKARTVGLWPLKPVGSLIGYGLLGDLRAHRARPRRPFGRCPGGGVSGRLVGLSGFEQLVTEKARAAGAGELPLRVGSFLLSQLAILPLRPPSTDSGTRRGARMARLAASEAHATRRDARRPGRGRRLGLVARTADPSRVRLPDATGWLGLTAMIDMCIVFGAISGWLRLRSGSVGARGPRPRLVQRAGGTYLHSALAGERIDTTEATVLGWSGWDRAARARDGPRRHRSAPTSRGRPGGGNDGCDPAGDDRHGGYGRCRERRAANMSDNRLTMVGDHLVVEPLGLDKLWTFTRRWQIPLAHVEAFFDPSVTNGPRRG